MKIAIVSDAIYPYNKGGKEKRIYEISTRLAKRGHDVHIYTMRWWSQHTVIPAQAGIHSIETVRGSEQSTNDNHRIENRVHLHAISNYYPLYSGERRSIKQALLFGIGCWKLIFEHFDIVDVDHMPFFPLFSVKLVCLLKRKKMYATWHEVWGLKYWREYLGVLGFFAYLIERISVMLPDKIIAVSQLTADRLKSEFGVPTSPRLRGASQKSVEVVDNGIDYETIEKVKPAKETSDIIFVGRLLKHKNVDILLHAIKLLITDFRLLKTNCIVIGNGPEKQNLISLTMKLGLENHVVYKGSVEDQKDVYALMKSSKVFVLPSTREGFGIVVLEANACGLPVITVDYPDNAAKDLISSNVNGILTKLDAEQIAAQIQKILDGSKKFNPNTNKNYSWKETIEKLLTVYHS